MTEVFETPADAPDRTTTPPRRSHRRLIAALVVALCAIGGGASAVYEMRADDLGSGVALRVYGHKVKVAELEKEADTLRALYAVQTPTDPAKLADFKRDLAKAYAVSLILDKQAAARDVVIGDKEAQDFLTRFIAQQYGSTPDAYNSFVQGLATVGTTADAVKAEIKRQLALSRLFDDITAKVSVTDAEVSAAFEQRKDTLGSPERRQLSNIVVATEADANAVHAALLSGQDFASVAAAKSLDTATNSHGGDLGTVAAADLDPDYAKAAFAAKAGEVFGPVHTANGWNVGKVVSVLPAAPAAFTEIKDKLKAQLETEAQINVWRSWLAGQIKSAHVRYASSYRPADPDAAPTSAPGALPSSATTTSAPK